MYLLPSFLYFLILLKRINCDVLVFSPSDNQIVDKYRDLPAVFGDSFPVSGMKALAVLGYPSNGCTKLAPPPKNTSFDHNINTWVVIVARYNCTFEEKVRNAQTAGFDAAIIHNVGSNELEQMSADNQVGIYIPSMFVGETTGRMIIYNYQFNSNYALLLNSDAFPFNINTHLIIPFAIVVGLCFVLMVGFMVVKCARERRRLRRHRLPTHILKKIPTTKFVKGQPYETCAICLDDYTDGEKLRVLPCSHAYHCKCIDPWLTKNRRVCPICKRKVFARGEPRTRQRRVPDDSVSDTDTDDTTPLLNPVEHNNHGTFQRSTAENGQQPTSQRINPFDRLPNPTLMTGENDDDVVGLWNRILRYWRFNPSTPIISEPSVTVEDGIIVQSSTDVSMLGNRISDVPPVSSNNSRSLLDFEDDDDDDQRHSIYEPQQPVPLPSPQGRLGVVALPNTEFNPELPGRQQTQSGRHYVV